MKLQNQIRNQDGLTEEEFLAAYKPGDYERPSVTADILLFTAESNKEENIRNVSSKDLKLLLIQRKNHPFLGKWAIPGGFVDMDESTETAAYRELKEETSITDDVYLEQLYTFSEPNRDPRMRVISTAYMALTPSSNINKTKSGDDASDAKWFNVKRTVVNETENSITWNICLSSDDDALIMNYLVKNEFTAHTTNTTITYHEETSNTGLAFDHIEIINMALQRLKNKVSYTNIAFHLLPEYFTLTELQNIYEILLNEELVKPNFRKKIKPMVIKTNRRKRNVGYNPPYLYTQNHKYFY